MKKMGIMPPAAPVLSASKRAYNAIFAANLTPSHVIALDELFLATNNRAGRLVEERYSRMPEWVAQRATETSNSVGCNAAFSSIVYHLCNIEVRSSLLGWSNNNC